MPVNGPLARSASFNAAVRTERYSDFGTTTKPKFGGDWRPVSWLMFRGSVNKGFHAPELIDLHQQAAFTTLAYPDEKFHGKVVQVIQNFSDDYFQLGHVRSNLAGGVRIPLQQPQTNH